MKSHERADGEIQTEKQLYLKSACLKQKIDVSGRAHGLIFKTVISRIA